MTFDFHDRRVIVAGGSKGIGRAIALGFARAGASVSVCARGQASLDALAAEVADEGLSALHVAPCDIGDKAALGTYLQTAIGELGGLDVLVNCASAFGREDNEEGWLSSVEVDLMGTVRASHICLPALKQTGGTIINIASIAALHASTRTAPTPPSRPRSPTTPAALLRPWRRIKCALMALPLARSNFRAACGIRPGRTIQSSTSVFAEGFPSGAWARQRKSPTWRYSWPPIWPGG